MPTVFHTLIFISLSEKLQEQDFSYFPLFQGLVFAASKNPEVSFAKKKIFLFAPRQLIWLSIFCPALSPANTVFSFRNHYDRFHVTGCKKVDHHDWVTKRGK